MLVSVVGRILVWWHSEVGKVCHPLLALVFVGVLSMWRAEQMGTEAVLSGNQTYLKLFQSAPGLARKY